MFRFIIPTTFTAVDHYTKTTQKMRGSLNALLTDSEAATSKLMMTLDKTSKKYTQIGMQTGIAGVAMLAPLALATNAAIKFEDSLADISKTTGLTGRDLEAFGGGILDVAKGTRTSIDDLLKIGEIGGQLGVAKNELLGFTKSANMFAVAMGNEFSGGVEEAITSVSKLTGLFNDVKLMPISEGITRVGSAINALGAAGNATSPNISDFALRVGALPGVLKPTAQATLSLGAFMEEMGLRSEVAAGGFTQLMMDASRNLPLFAAQMNMSATAAEKLLGTDPTKFAATFASSLTKLSAVQTADVFKKLSIAGQEEIKVLGAMGYSMDRLRYLQQMASDEFRKATSLTMEYNTKNNTTAGLIEQAKNNFQVLAITIGTQLLPAMARIAKVVMPIVSAITDWVKNHKQLTKVLLLTVGTLGALSLGISVVSFAIGGITKAWWLWTGAVKAWQFTAGLAATMTGTLNGAILGSEAATKGAAVGMRLMNTSALGLLATFTKLAAITGFIWGLNKLTEKRDDSADRMKFMLTNLPQGVDPTQFSQQFQDALSPGHISLANRIKGVKSWYPQSLYDSLNNVYDKNISQRDSITNSAQPYMPSPGSIDSTVRSLQAQSEPEVSLNNNRRGVQDRMEITINDNTKSGISVNTGSVSMAKVTINGTHSPSWNKSVS